jgi:predicted transcriptional regulator
MSDLSAFLNEQMNNPEFAQEYNVVQPEMDAIRPMIKARKSQNLTQKQLAELVGIDQGDISKLENGLRNPTIQLLKRIADSMNMTLKIEFIPKQQNNKKKI